MSTVTNVGMKLRFKRVLLAILAISAADVGGWATVAPHSFYNSFPGGGHHWVSMDGPYNEHLVRDVGGLYLALLVMSIWAYVRPDLSRLAGASWLIFSLLHFAYHLGHLHMFSTTDKVGMAVSLGGTVLIAAALLLAPEPVFQRRTRSDASCGSWRYRCGWCARRIRVERGRP